MYAIAIGPIAIATWGNASTASAAASQEASHIVTRCIARWPAIESRSGASSRIRFLAYTQSVIQIAWPAQRLSAVTEKGTEILLSVGLQILAFEPAPGAQSSIASRAARACTAGAHLMWIAYALVQRHVLPYLLPCRVNHNCGRIVILGWATIYG